MDEILTEHDIKMEQLRKEHERIMIAIAIKLQALRALAPKKQIYFGKVKIE
jgi:hypothetical protein